MTCDDTLTPIGFTKIIKTMVNTGTRGRRGRRGHVTNQHQNANEFLPCRIRRRRHERGRRDGTASHRWHSSWAARRSGTSRRGNWVRRDFHLELAPPLTSSFTYPFPYHWHGLGSRWIFSRLDPASDRNLKPNLNCIDKWPVHSCTSGWPRPRHLLHWNRNRSHCITQSIINKCVKLELG